LKSAGVIGFVHT